jgi:hypothetical protein
MIPKKSLRDLIVQKLKDADALFSMKRYAAAIYLAGYALELTLKLNVCKIFKFHNGFPESKAEFVAYQKAAKSQKTLAIVITEIRDIRHHNLNKLLYYSGAEFNIKLNYLHEWNLVSSWDPEMRYRVQKILKRDAQNNLNAIKTLVREIL